MSAPAYVIAAARKFSDLQAGECGIDQDDMWKTYGEEFIADSTAALNAAGMPDLLAALQEAVDRITGLKGGSVSDTVSLMRAAIAAATGEQQP